MKTQPKLDRDPPNSKGILTDAPKPPMPPKGTIRRERGCSFLFVIILVLAVLAFVLVEHFTKRG
jgi:hypothetical protein